MAVSRLKYPTFYNISSSKSKVTATGGNSTTDGNGYRVHTFLGNGTFTLSTNNTTINYLIIAGGGGGGSNMGGGGGAGGYLTGTMTLSSGNYDIAIGSGGAGALAGTSMARGSSGLNTTALSLTAVGGGGAGSDYGSSGVFNNAVSGGSGGGAQGNSAAGGAATSGQGSVGGNGAGSYYPAGGGGAGAPGVANPGTGGTGLSNSIIIVLLPCHALSNSSAFFPHPDGVPVLYNLFQIPKCACLLRHGSCYSKMRPVSHVSSMPCHHRLNVPAQPFQDCDYKHPAI